MVKSPSDLGFDDSRYKLSELITNNHIITHNNHFEMGSLIPIIAKTMTEVKLEQKITEQQRCFKAIELAKDKTSVYWCNTNNESATLKAPPEFFAISINALRAGIYERSATSFIPVSLA